MINLLSELTIHPIEIKKLNSQVCPPYVISFLNFHIVRKPYREKDYKRSRIEKA